MKTKHRSSFAAVCTVAALSIALSALAEDEFSESPALGAEVAKGFLPSGSGKSSWSLVYRRTVEADVAADAAWRALRNRAEYDAHRKEMKRKMLEAIGPFPAKTPLNFRSVKTFERDGYRVEHTVFESMPGLLVPANLFVPTAAEFKAPFPAVVLSCGHGRKDSDVYRRACVNLVKRGFVAFMFEPYEQGERVEYPKYSCTQNHNLIGLKAMLLGSSMAMLRIWDGIRAIDCVEAFPYVDRSRIGYMGQSGGGTMSALMNAVEDRLVAVAPSCFLMNFGYLFRTMGAQDAEQNIFGQLSFGLNHTGYVLIPDVKVAVTGRYNDMFDYGGTAQLMDTVRTVAKTLGVEDHYAQHFSPGPHGWTESTMQASVDWMSIWMQGRKDLLPVDMAKLRQLDFGFDLGKADLGLADSECGVLAGKRIDEIPGSRDIHSIFRDQLSAIKAARPQRTVDETAALVKRVACVRMPEETGVVVKEMGARRCGQIGVRRLAFVFPDGFAVPAVLLEGGRTNAAPVIVAGSRGRAAMLPEARGALKRGSPVLVLDVTGTGEIGISPNIHYGSYDTPEEDVAIMLYLLGESIVGRRATELLAVADYLKDRSGKKPSVIAQGSVAVAAAHAYAADRKRISHVRTVDAPPSWTEYIEKPGCPFPYRYTWCVHGGLKDYDWVDLLEEGNAK